jgi:ATP-dependent RNA helicase SUPV3L1/SUV3
LARLVNRTIVKALLGPTNTGKTHRAIERMLEYPSGAIALPLRLLAREVYDRIAAKVGQESVALITGEERRVPRRASYFVSTCEAMDTERVVDFVALDEIQLAEDHDRGHVFTDRLLHARGRQETWLLGSHAARSVVEKLLPHAVFDPAPRLSKLSHAGSFPLKKLPARSAVVAFSMSEVYELADRARSRGGAAVVLGALSPRARNAQVAMFQAGEVDMLVATDAIGMGLNLDVRHVAFAKLRKFDGQRVRDAEIGELCQIAGRAGRYVTDGTFGGLSPLVFPRELVYAIESHAVPPLRRLRYRARPTFGSLPELTESLRERPKVPWLLPAAEVDDTRALALLSARPEVRARAIGEPHVRLLWDVCQVPDFRKLLFESHAAFLAEVFVTLIDRGPLADDDLSVRFGELSEPTGDVDTLVAKIAHVRLLSYIAQRADFVKDSNGWRERAASWEDRLSDALHLALVSRFVNQGTKKTSGPGPRPSEPRGSSRHTLGSRDDTSVKLSGPFAALAQVRARLAKAPEIVVESSLVDAVVQAPYAALGLAQSGEITFDGAPLARLVRGKTLLEPGFRIVATDDLRGGDRLRLERRIGAHVQDLVRSFTRALSDIPPELQSEALRGVIYRLREGLGSLSVREASREIRGLSQDARAFLTARGVSERSGTWVTVPTPEARRVRAALVFVFTGVRTPDDDRESLSLRELPRDVSPGWLGYVRMGDRFVRADRVPETLLVDAHLGSTQEPSPEPDASTWSLEIPENA